MSLLLGASLLSLLNLSGSIAGPISGPLPPEPVVHRVGLASGSSTSEFDAPADKGATLVEQAAFDASPTLFAEPLTHSSLTNSSLTLDPVAPQAIAYGFGSLKELMIGLDPVIDWSQLAPPRVSTTPPMPALEVAPLPPVPQATSASQPVRIDSSIPDNPWQRAFSQPGAGNQPPRPVAARRNTQPRRYPSFSSGALDMQLRRYLNYMEAVGPADIFIVGSARAIQGVDPLILEQALAERGYGDVKVFNWGVNGSTAQVVDVLLREILTPAQLPKLVVWADGSRSFSSGRRDRTYENIRLSAGYRALSEGKRPFLNTAERTQLSGLRDALASPPQISDELKQKLGKQVAQQPAQHFRRFFVDWCSDVQGPCDRSATFQAAPLSEALESNATAYLEASGFQINSRQFIPQFYFQQFKRISGAHDGDYKNFSLFGDQHRALKRIKALAKRQNMPVVFLSMPLTNTYLDSVRRKREAAFITYMQSAARDSHFSFYDFSRLWPNRNEFFLDPSHVNRYGAAAVSWQFAKALHPSLLKQVARSGDRQTSARAGSSQ